MPRVKTGPVENTDICQFQPVDYTYRKKRNFRVVPTYFRQANTIDGFRPNSTIDRSPAAIASHVGSTSRGQSRAIRNVPQIERPGDCSPGQTRQKPWGLCLFEDAHDLVDDAPQDRFFFKTVCIAIDRNVVDIRAERGSMCIVRSQITCLVFLDELCPVASAA